MASREFTEATRKFADEESARAMAAIYEAASESERKKLQEAAEGFSRLHTSNDSLVRDRSKNYITNAVMDAAEKHADVPAVRTAVATLTGDANAGATLQAAAHGDEQIDQLRGQIHDEQRRSRSSTSPAVKELEAKIHTIEGAHDGLHDKVAQHLDGASKKRQPAVAAAQGTSPQAVTEQAKDDAYLADALKDMRKEDSKLDKLLTALKEAGPDESKRKTAAKDLAEEVVKFAEKHPESQAASAAVERLAPGKGQALLKEIADSDERKEKANQIINPPSDEIRNGLRPSNAEHRAALDEWYAQSDRHSMKEYELITALTNKITKGNEKPAPQQAAAVAAPAPAPEQAPATEYPHPRRNYKYEIDVPVKGEKETISGVEFQMALKQMGGKLGDYGVGGVDGKVGGATVEAFREAFKEDKIPKTTPSSLELTKEQAAKIHAKAAEFKAQHPEEVKKIEAYIKAHPPEKDEPVQRHASARTAHRGGATTPKQQGHSGHDDNHPKAGDHPALAHKADGKPAPVRKADAAEHAAEPKTVNYMIADELKPINPKLIRQMVAYGGTTDTDKLLDMKWFNERAKFIGDNYAKTNDGIAYAAAHGGQQKQWNEALADAMHFKPEPIVAGMKPAAVRTQPSAKPAASAQPAPAAELPPAGPLHMAKAYPSAVYTPDKTLTILEAASGVTGPLKGKVSPDEMVKQLQRQLGKETTGVMGTDELELALRKVQQHYDATHTAAADRNKPVVDKAVELAGGLTHATVASTVTERLGEKEIRELAASLSHNDSMRDSHTSIATVNKAIETSLGNTKDVVADGKLTDKELIAALNQYAKEHNNMTITRAEDAVKKAAANAEKYDPFNPVVAIQQTPGSKGPGNGRSVV